MYSLVVVDDHIHVDNHCNLVPDPIPFLHLEDIDYHDNRLLVVDRLNRLDSMDLVANSVVGSLVAGI